MGRTGNCDIMHWYEDLLSVGWSFDSIVGYEIQALLDFVFNPWIIDFNELVVVVVIDVETLGIFEIQSVGRKFG